MYELHSYIGFQMRGTCFGTNLLPAFSQINLPSYNLYSYKMERPLTWWHVYCLGENLTLTVER